MACVRLRFGRLGDAYSGSELEENLTSHRVHAQDAIYADYPAIFKTAVKMKTHECDTSRDFQVRL